MSQKQTITLNGREYDAHTGLPVAEGHASTTRASLRRAHSASPIENNPAPKVTRNASQAQQIHQKTQRSQTLNRKFTKKPGKSDVQQIVSHQVAPKAVPVTPSIVRRPVRRLDGIKHTPRPTSHTVLASQKKSPSLQPVQHRTPVHVSTKQSDIPPQAHPVVARAHQLQAAKKVAPQKTLQPASILKQVAIKEALDNAPKHHAKQHKQSSHKQRFAGVVFGCAALVLFGGYVTYLNVPNLSVRVAAAQAGIDASYPGYQPDGYRLNGPVAYSDGQVQMKFAANTGDTDFTLKQSKSSWDSSALLENFVKEKSDDEYSISQEKGITIYSYSGNAAWVSGGILYTIDGNAPLSPDQIRKIATSV